MGEAFLKQAKTKAAKYCSLKERAPQQVLEKLLSWDLSEDEAQNILTELIEENFIDEARFARAFCHDKFEFNQWGKNKIRIELNRYNLPDQIVDEGLLHIDEDRYMEVLERLASKKWISLNSETDPWKKKNKVVAYLLRKGYETEFVWGCIGRLSASSE